MIRDVSALLGMVAFSMTVWRFLSHWNEMVNPLRIVTFLLAALLLICSLGTARAASLHAPFNELQYALMVHYTGTIIFSVFGPRMLRRFGLIRDVTTSGD